jgi:hypothetical protein
VFDFSSTSDRSIDFTKTVWKRQWRGSRGELRSEAPRFLQRDFWPGITSGLSVIQEFLLSIHTSRHPGTNLPSKSALAIWRSLYIKRMCRCGRALYLNSNR